MATLKDVAREAGLTVTTVSRVLNNRGYISEDAKRRVAEAVKKLNYQPNEVARSLQNKSSNTIGVIMPHITHPYFAQMISELEQAAYENGYKILLFNSLRKKEREEEFINMCKAGRVAGIILSSGSVSFDDEAGNGIPIVTLERFVDKTSIASVECDNYQGGVLAAKKLIACGCKHVVHIGSLDPDILMPADYRSEGFRETCESYGIDFAEAYTDTNEFEDMNYVNALEKIFHEHPGMDGIFANSDVIAVQILQVCRKLNISVPEDLKLIGFDDVEFANMSIPRLTTIHQPIRELAYMAVELLVSAVDGNLVPTRTILPVKLVERETT